MLDLNRLGKAAEEKVLELYGRYRASEVGKERDLRCMEEMEGMFLEGFGYYLPIEQAATARKQIQHPIGRAGLRAEVVVEFCDVGHGAKIADYGKRKAHWAWRFQTA